MLFGALKEVEEDEPVTRDEVNELIRLVEHVKKRACKAIEHAHEDMPKREIRTPLLGRLTDVKLQLEEVRRWLPNHS